MQGNCTKILVASNGTDGPQEEDDDERKEQDDDREEQEHSKHNNCCRKGSRTPPVDWRPQDKCYFCDKGRLLTVNERGDLEIGSGLVNAEPNLKITVRVTITINRLKMLISFVALFLRRPPWTATVILVKSAVISRNQIARRSHGRPQPLIT